MKLSIIMPCYNEVGTVKDIIEKVLSLPIDKELIIVDDGSTDGSGDAIQSFENNPDVKIVSNDGNHGKGFSIRAGIPHCTGNIITIQDADLETNPENLLELVKPIQNNETKVVYGSRILNNDKKYSAKYYYGGKLVTWVANILFRQKLTDEPTCYKVFDSDLLKSIELKCNGFEFCPEVTAKVSKLGHKIKELPMDYFPRSKDEGKKLQISDGFIAIWTLLKYRFIS